MNRKMISHGLSFIGLLVFCLLAFGSLDTDKDTEDVQSQSADYTLTANQLYSEYDDNEVAADAKFKDKIVVVSGVIQDIGKDVMDNAYIIVGGSGFLDGVQCTFTQAEESSIASLSKGQRVSVKGQVSGKMIGHVLLNKARLQ